jgi:hypothetical protein
VKVTTLDLRRRRPNGQPQFGESSKRELKVRRQNADDPRRLPAQDDRSVEDAGIAAEPPPPDAIGQQHHARRGRIGVLRPEVAAELRLHAEQAKEPVGDFGNRQTIGRPCPGQRPASSAVAGQIDKRALMRSEVEKVRPGHVPPG